MKLKLIGALMAGALSAWSASYDLAPPALTSFDAVSGAQGDRGVFFTALSNFSIGTAGIWMDPLAGGATEIRVSIYQAGGLSAFGQLATATISIADIGMALYNIPVNFSFSQNSEYYLAFDVVLPPGSFSSANNIQFYNFDQANNAPFSVAGVLSVQDGALGGNFRNTVLPHIVLNTDNIVAPPSSGGGNQNAVPEPSSLALLASAALLPAFRRWMKQ